MQNDVVFASVCTMQDNLPREMHFWWPNGRIYSLIQYTGPLDIERIEEDIER